MPSSRSCLKLRLAHGDSVRTDDAHMNILWLVSSHSFFVFLWVSHPPFTSLFPPQAMFLCIIITLCCTSLYALRSSYITPTPPLLCRMLPSITPLRIVRIDTACFFLYLSFAHLRSFARSSGYTTSKTTTQLPTGWIRFPFKPYRTLRKGT